ncbi:hypothetical protein CIW48_27245 [Methylobacterium sp. P1-11]|uniref:hypothetical protein n=1 Tax=Methylobacterium sp. P1-11 TaxID=2024616 RepID=UPI0011EC0A36|nr:hypothetical protein [Methylobacterium sp. P1-11]KAA0117899.1 hypothetical protein CIW48_27245 [Methylobacterium sp. P1-11]
MILVWYDPDCDEIWVSGQEQSYARRSLVAGATGGNITVMMKAAVAGDYVVNTPWANVGNCDGVPFPDQGSVLAYLQDEFAKSRPPTSGPRGPGIFTAPGDPDPTFGMVGDLYLDAVTGNLFTKGD